jgi:uncharacterized membrane protein
VSRGTASGGRLEQLEDTIEVALKLGLAVSTVLLLFGLGASSTTALRWGILLLMLTPVARVAVVTVGLAIERDWTFAVVSFFVLAVLASGIWVAIRR